MSSLPDFVTPSSDPLEHLIPTTGPDLEALEQPEDDAPPSRQTGELFRVYLEGEAPYTVRVGNRERLAYEKTAARHKEWPSPDNGRSFVVTFLTFAAARRAGRTSLTFEQWQEQLEEWEHVKDEPTDPTR